MGEPRRQAHARPQRPRFAHAESDDLRARAGEGEEGEGEEGEGGDDSGKKKKKKERKKKEKAPKAEEVPTKPEKKLPKKRVRATFILCFSILAGIIILTVVMTKATNLMEARSAYENQDYQTTYEDLYGLELKEEDKEILNIDSGFLTLTVIGKCNLNHFNGNTYSQILMEDFEITR